MPKIILIETSTALCSAALIEGEEIVGYKQSDEPRAHAALTAPFIKELLDARGLKVTDCDAVCVSAGPGSYTGLRVGASTAKGLCFGAGIPLLSVGTLDTLVAQAFRDGLVPEGCRYIIPMVDARRMEVYTAIYKVNGSTAEAISEVQPQVIDADSFRDQMAEGPVLFIGDGAGKCADILAAAGARFEQCCPRADAMLSPTLEAWKTKKFCDTAYFEPFYLKDFIATVSKKSLF